MMRRDGSWPRRKAGKATEAMIDFSDLGGMLMISRLISPRRTRSSWYAMASTCQLLMKVWPGDSVMNTMSTKDPEVVSQQGLRAGGVHHCVIGFASSLIYGTALSDSQGLLK